MSSPNGNGVQHYGQHFQLVNLSDPAQVAYLKSAAFFDVDEDDVGKNVYARFDTLAQSAIVESNYVDTDYRAGFARFHYLRHHDTARRCTRIHFFKALIGQREIAGGSPLLQDAYLGYSTLRPLPGYRIGRTVLSSSLAAELDGLTNHLSCRAKFRANIAGNELTLTGVPYIQQDRLTSACASAAIWVVGSLMSQKFAPQFRQYNTSEITDLANQYIISTGRPIPSLGLTLEQMMYCLALMGYEPVLHVPPSAQEAQRIAGIYSDSSIPIIVSLSYREQRDGHAVTVVGHRVNWKATPRLEKEPPLSFCRMSDFTTSFLIQDDSSGPFRNMEFWDWSEAVASNYVPQGEVPRYKQIYSCVATIDRGHKNEEIALVDAFVIPFPPGVTLDSDGAEDHAISLFAAWHAVTAKRAPRHGVMRTFLQPSNLLKQQWTTAHGLPEDLSLELRRHLMSKWAWVTEFAELNSLRKLGSVLGQVVQDSASHPDDAFLEKDLLAFNMPGHLALVQPDGRHAVMRITDYEPYSRFADIRS